MSRQLRPCGTRAAYIRHLRHGEIPCDPCTKANRISRTGGQSAAPLSYSLAEIRYGTGWSPDARFILAGKVGA